MAELTHLNEKGHATMVDVGGKAVTTRTAVARGEVHMAPATLAAILDGTVPKGDVLAAARIAGIMGAKRTPDLIPLCHPLLLTKAEVEFEVDQPGSRVLITATVRTSGQTGVEMEALTAVSVAALTIYDMAKALEKGMVIANIALLEKHGGKSGDWVRPPDEPAAATAPVAPQPAVPAPAAPQHLPRYATLLTYLVDIEDSEDDETLSFQQLEVLLGHRLPAAAREQVGWWSNDERHMQAQSWVRAGWRVDGISLAQEWVRFRRQQAGA